MKHILVVDDKKINITAARSALENQYAVTDAASSLEAMAALGGENIDLILLDMKMPEPDGFWFMEQIQNLAAYKNIPVIFMHDMYDSRLEQRAYLAGARDFLVKPVNPAVLRIKVERILSVEEDRHALAYYAAKIRQEQEDFGNTRYQKDQLTGLFSKGYAMEQIGKLLMDETEGALVRIDIENLETIMNTYGHLAGDRIEKAMAKTMQKYLEEEYVLCRMGIGEFLAFIQKKNSQNSLGNLLEDMIADFRKQMEEAPFSKEAYLSVGISCAPENGTEFERLLLAAEKALYHISITAKNTCHFYGQASEIADNTSGKLMDLAYLQEIMNKTDVANGAYMMDYDSFYYVYNFVRRFVERSNREVQTVLFTLTSSTDADDMEELEAAISMLERAIFSSLRRTDVSTRYSSKQMIVILLDANAENSDLVAKRIIQIFEKLYLGKKFVAEYDVVKLEGKIPAEGFRRKKEPPKENK